jgi:general nucleoside transport system permease protein
MGNAIVSWIVAAVIYGSVLALGALGETINEKSGHLCLGVPGIMYFSAIISYYLTKVYSESVPNPNAVLVVLIALGSSLLLGGLFGLIYSLMTVTFKANQNVVGLAISAFGVGFGKFFSIALGLKNDRLAFAGQLFNAGIPGLKDIPYVGSLLFGYGFLTYVVIILLIVATIFFRKTQMGMNLRAVGESPATADANGISVTAYRYGATLVGCGLCGMAGMAFIFYFSEGLWSTNNNIEAFGWLALCLVIFSSWKPKNLLWGAPLFGLLYWAYNYLPLIAAIRSFTGLTEILQMLPYFVTIIILIINSMRKKKENQPPEALGLSYFREDR